MNLAKTIFAGVSAGARVEDEIDEIVGEGFLVDTCHDYYDSSLEAIFSSDFSGLTREQTNKILDLGFDRVYESVGDKGTYWCRDSSGPCSPKKIDQDTRRSVEKMRAALCRAAQLAEIAADWNLGSDGKVEIDGEWIECRDLEKEFSQFNQKTIWIDMENKT